MTPMRPIAVAVATMAVMAIAFAPELAPAAPGTGAHFQSATGTVDTTTGDYIATWLETGLGTSGLAIEYELTATNASSTWQCFNNGSNQPQGGPQAGGSGTITAHASFQPNQGQVNGSITLTPEVGTASCKGGGLKLCLVQVSYPSVTLTDVTNSVTTPLPGFSSVNIPPPSKNNTGVCQ